jgi:hypothetical protein
VPWWAALVIAVTATAVGYAIDAGHKDLTHVFAGFYIAGCVAAVLAVRQDGVFTAIIQPPLILFCAVPGAYWMFHGRKTGNLKDLLINCGYPLIERFPLMLGTAGAVLLIGLLRWYFGKSQPAAAEAPDDAAATAARGSFLGALGAKLNALLGLGDTEDAEEAAPSGSKRTRQPGRSPKAASRTGRTPRGDRPERPGRAHSRRARPPLDDDERDPREARDERPRRRRPAPPRDFDPADPPPRPRRRPRPHDDADIRQPRETGREPRTRRNPYDRPSERPYERPAPRGSRLDGYDPYEPHEPRRRRATPTGTGSTHHPISQVRYRDTAPAEDPGPARRRRAQRGFPAESWEYEG